MRKKSYSFLCIIILLQLAFTRIGKTQEVRVDRMFAVEPEMIGEICTLDPSGVNANYKFAPQGVNRPLKMSAQAATASFEVDYVNSCNGEVWPEEAKTAFEYATDIWSTHLSSPVPIRIRASWSELGENTLGSAGPTFLFTLTGQDIFTDTFYPIALASALTGEDLVGETQATHDVEMNISCNFNRWYFGTDANTPANRIDFVTVVLHEIGHGIGFTGSMQATNSIQEAFYGIGPNGLPIVYDQFVLDRGFSSILDKQVFPAGSGNLYQAVTGQTGGIFFNGLEAEFALDNQRVQLYSPNPFQSGSSFSHLDQVTFGQSENALMRPQIDSQFAVHSPGPVFCGMLDDMLWPLGSSCEDLLLDDSDLQRPFLSLPGNGAMDQTIFPQLVWSDVAGATNYRVEISRDFNHNQTVLSVQVAGTSYTVPEELDFATRFFWRVRAESGNTEGSWSNTFRFNTILGVPNPVTLIAPENNAENLQLGFRLSWQPQNGIEEYQVQVSSDDDFTELILDETVVNTSYPTTGLLDFYTTYYWRVRASNIAGQGDWGDVWSFRTIIERPEPVVLSGPIDGENQVPTNADFTWQESERASSYIIQVSDQENFSQSLIQQTTQIPAFSVLDPLNFAEIYYWRVKAVNIGGESDWSAPRMFTTEVRETKIFPNYPNPFNTSTTLKYQLSGEVKVSIELFDITGRKVSELINEQQQPGVYFLSVNGSGFASGMYLVRFIAGDVMDVQKVAVIK